MANSKINQAKMMEITCSYCGFNHTISEYPFDISEPLYDKMVDFLYYIMKNMDSKKIIKMTITDTAKSMKTRKVNVKNMINKFMEMRLLIWQGKTKYRVNFNKLAEKQNGKSHDKVVNIDFNFKKIWLQNTLKYFAILDSQRLRFVQFLIDNMGSDNTVNMTRKEMAERSNMSYKTVCDTINRLIKTKFIRVFKGDIYKINLNNMLEGNIISQDDGRVIFIKEKIK